MKFSLRSLGLCTATLVAGLALGVGLPAIHGSALAQGAGGNAAPRAYKGMIPRDKPLWIMMTHDLPGKRETISPEIWNAHIASDQAQEKNGTRVIGGGVSDKDGKRVMGLIIFRAKDYDEARKIADADPAVQAGERTVDVYQYQVNEGHMTFSVNFSDSSASFQ